ncbi:hypothetical protein CNMCM5623_004045 [Aspergillus felis]|uniref:AMP-dependent synthetase/ligase domain-containing protein n=1 Tax=Aspergillus felis TaxID=1287682 RepID=A0A8H6QFK0_9EURO|nr:hypothetical protein CNMCM5623_004045 [Aspergillus felis]
MEATYANLLDDMLNMQLLMKRSLPDSMFQNGSDILLEETPFIFILAPGNYSFAVAALSILSIGGAFAPLATGVLPEEACHLLQRCKAGCILADPQHVPLAQECQRFAASEGHDVSVIPIRWNGGTGSYTLEDSALVIDPQRKIAPHRPGLLLFTSGTSGPPKGVVHPRRLLYNLHELSSPHEVFLSHQAVHWGSATLTLMGCILGGARMEVIAQDARALWERLREGGVTTLGCSPRVWEQMMIFYQENLKWLPHDQHDAYVCGARGLETALSRGMMPSPSLLRFWREEIGRPLHVCYGITELGATVMRTCDNTDVTLECCIGRPLPGTTIKLSNGNYGEILIKKSVMFSRYLGDSKATEAAFDHDGFYRTGDQAYRVGEDYILEGRASTDFIRTQGLKVPILEVENRLMELPWIAEGCALPVTDNQLGQRVAVLVRLRSHAEQSLCMDRVAVERRQAKSYLPLLRHQLGATLPAFMLPTALRILVDGEEIPRTPSLKPIRAKAVKQYFPQSDDWSLPDDIEVCGPWEHLTSRSPRAWDWSSLVAQKAR